MLKGSPFCGGNEHTKTPSEAACGDGINASDRRVFTNGCNARRDGPFIIQAQNAPRQSPAPENDQGEESTASDPTDEFSESRVLDVVIVSSFDREYLANKGQTAAVGLDLTQLETPAAISVIPQDLLQDQQVNNVDDALRNVAGVVKFKTGNGGEERFSIRGFESSGSIYKDGARINNSLNVSNIPSTETANIDRIEVLKGPSALIYGQGEPGGIVNYVTKRPELERSTSVEFLAGSFDFYKVEADTTGAVPGTNDKLAYRVVGAYEDSESYRNFVERQRLLINPTLSWMPTNNFDLLLGFEYIDDDYTQDRGQVLDGNFVDGYFYNEDRLDPEEFIGLPGWNNRSQAESQRLYAIANFQATDNWRIEGTFSNTENEKTFSDSSASFVSFLPLVEIIGPVGSFPFGDQVNIGPSLGVGKGESTQFTVKNFVDFTDGFGFEHEILASYTYEELSSVSRAAGTDGVHTYNLGTGVYSTLNFATFAPFTESEMDALQAQVEAAGGDFVRLSPILGFTLSPLSEQGTQRDVEEAGFNALDYITLNDQWAVLIGGRYSEFDDINSGFSDDDFSIRGGVVYTPQEILSFYASYSEGYTSSGGNLGVDDQQIDPERSESFELGGKLALRDEQILLTAVLYDTRKKGIAFVANPFQPDGTPTPDADLRFGNIGETRSQGVELEIVGQITDNWRIVTGYTYIDNEILEGDPDPDPLFGSLIEGNRLGGIPEHSFNLYSFYDFEVADGELGFGGGLFAVTDTFVSAANVAEFDGWAQVDLATYYKRDNWKIQLNVNNVLDEEYRQAQGGGTSDLLGAVRVGTATPRSVTASVAFEF